MDKKRTITYNVYGGQINTANDKSTIHATQNNGVTLSELDNIINGITENLSALKKEDVDAIEDVINMIKEEINYRCSIKMLENICHITDMIKENNELRDKFVDEFNKLKCSDPSEIMEEFRRVCDMVDIDRLEKENSLILKELKKRGIDGKQ